MGSCQVNSSLSQAESLMQDAPEEALAILEKISPTELNRKEQSAQYALLLSQALDKNYIDVDSDTLIRIAVDYYEHSKNRKNRMLAYYYEGIVLLNACDYARSAVFFEKACEEAIELSDVFTLGLSYRALARIMNSTLNLPQAIKYEEKAIACFKSANKPLYESYAWLSLAIDCSNNKQYERAIAIADSMFSVVNATVLKDSFEQVKAEVLIESGNCDFRIPVDIYNRANKDYFLPPDYGYFAYALDKLGLRDSADVNIQRALSISKNQKDTAGVRAFQARIEHNRRHFNNAFNLLYRAVEVQDSVTREILRQSVSVAQKEFYEKESQYRELEVRSAKRTTVLLSLGFIALSIAGLLLVLLRKRKNEGLLKDQMAQLALERQRAHDLETEKAHLLGSLFSERLGRIDRLAQEYVSAEAQEEKDRLFKEYKHRCASLKNDTQVYRALEEDLNRYCNKIMERLRAEVPAFKANHLQTIMLFFAGIPIISIQIITGKPSRKAVEMERSRYRKMIKDSKAEHATFFLEMLETKKRQYKE